MGRSFMIFACLRTATAAVIVGWAGMACGQDNSAPPAATSPANRSAAPSRSGAILTPFALAGMPGDQSVYAPPPPPRGDEGLNAGGVPLDFQVGYFTDSIYPGVGFLE